MVHAIMCLLIYLLLGCLFYSFMHCLHTCTRVSPPSLCGGACSRRIFHGINAVNKGPPWYPQELLNTTFVAELAATGATAVRLGVIWNGVMPSRGVLNMTYLGVIGQIVDTLAAAGIYSLLDAHQDGLSSEFCLYDAAPRWWIDMTHPAHAFPWPLDPNQTCYTRFWEQNYFSEACGVAFQALYQNATMQGVCSFCVCRRDMCVCVCVCVCVRAFAVPARCSDVALAELPKLDMGVACSCYFLAGCCACVRRLGNMQRTIHNFGPPSRRFSRTLPTYWGTS